MRRRTPRSSRTDTLVPHTTLFLSYPATDREYDARPQRRRLSHRIAPRRGLPAGAAHPDPARHGGRDQEGPRARPCRNRGGYAVLGSGCPAGGRGPMTIPVIAICGIATDAASWRGMPVTRIFVPRGRTVAAMAAAILPEDRKSTR